MRYAKTDDNYVRVNGGTNNSNLIGVSSHVSFTLDRVNGKYSYTITYVNGESETVTGLSGSSLSTSVSNATIVEAYSWANSQSNALSSVSYSYEYQPLAAPTATITAFAKSGDVYYPTFSFSSDQSGTPGYTDQTLTYTYSFNSASPVTASSFAATATGTLRVTVSAEGFQSSYTDIDVGSYTSTYYFDGGKIYDHATTGSSSYNVNKTGCNHYTLTGTYINGLTTSGLYHAWGITNNVSVGLYARTGSGSVTYTGSFPSGSYIYYFKVARESGERLVSSSSTVNFEHYYGLTDLRVLVPTASAEAYSLASGTNLTNNGEFASNVSGWNTVGTITKESDSSTSGSGFGWNGNGWAEMWADNNSASADYAHYNADCYIAQRYVNVPAGKYFVSADLVANGGNVSVYTISVNGVVQETDNGYFDNWTTKAHVINVPNDNSTITIKYAPETGGRAWVGIDNVSCIYDYKVPVTISSVGWATYCSPYNLDFSETGATVYTAARNTTTNNIALSEVSGGKVPANTGVILYKENGGEITPAVITTANAVENNELVGIIANTTVAYDPNDGKYNYIMEWDSENSKPMFSKAAANGATLRANKAYLSTAYNVETGEARALSVSSDAIETTGINNVQGSGVKTQGCYNLNGQRVSNPTKGLYIVNGRKVVVK